MNERKIREYKIIKNVDSAKLESEVVSMASQGYELLGGVQVVPDTSISNNEFFLGFCCPVFSPIGASIAVTKNFYLQTLVKYQ